MLQRIGDDSAGFSVDFDAAEKKVRVRAWGFWPVDVAKAFGAVVSDACRNRPSGTSLVFDMTDLKPMRDEGQEAFRAVLGGLPRLGIADTAVSTSNQLTKLQILRLAGGAVRFT